ncbi:hypothetical protein MFLAVUS_010838 [Mucor flavus]|uniref:Uncharacterized protein n=1 Tax=Mucor flavus TaxID=439312 RepID=A0ABP9ZDT7_9FUNG
MYILSRETGKSFTTTTDEYDSYYVFEFATYAYYKIVRDMESNNIDTNKVARTESSEYRYIPEVLSQIKRANALTRISNAIKMEGVSHSVKR